MLNRLNEFNKDSDKIKVQNYMFERIITLVLNQNSNVMLNLE